MTGMDLREELEGAIGDGPPLPAPEVRLAAGRAALRRRRAGVGAGAVVLVVTLASFTLGMGDVRSPGVTDSPSAPPTVGAVAEEWRKAGGFRFDLGGNLQFSPDAVVHERRDGVVPGVPSSIALDLTFLGERSWHLVRRGGSGNWVDIVRAPGEEPAMYRDFGEFVAKATFSLEQGVRFSGPEHITLETVGGAPQVAGAEVATGPVLREGRRGFGFEVESGGERVFVLLRPEPGDDWRLERIQAAPSRADLASWVRGLGWLPTGEEAP